MLRAGENLGWVDDSEDDDLGPDTVHAVAVKYYRQWRAGQLDPNEPVHVGLLLEAEHILNKMQRQVAAVLMPQTPGKLSPPGMPAGPTHEAAGLALASNAAANPDEPELR